MDAKIVLAEKRARTKCFDKKNAIDFSKSALLVANNEKMVDFFFFAVQAN